MATTDNHHHIAPDAPRGPRADACGPYKATDVRGEDEATVTRGSEGVQGLIHHRREASQGHL